MNILFLANHVNTGGITSYLRTLGAGLVARGHRVYFASGGGELAPVLQQEASGVWQVPVKTKSEVDMRILASFFMLQRRMKREKITLVHANTRVTQTLASLLATYSRVPFVSTCHGFFKPSFHRKLFPCWGRKVIAISAQVQDHLVHDLRVPKERVVLIHNGIDVKRFSDIVGIDHEARKRLLGVVEGPVVGIIARLSEVKGHCYLIEAMQEVCRRIPRALLVIAGEGPLQQELARHAERSGIARNILFFKNCQDTRELLSVMDVFVMPSLHEGLGLGLMEAMASGRAVVGSSVGGIKTLVTHGETGMLVPPKDPAALAGALICVLQNAELRSRYGAQAREFIAAHFNQETMVEHTERLYQSCLE